MSNQKRDEVCGVLVEKLTGGQPLNAAEKAHLSECAGCMQEVILRLDKMADAASAAPGMNGSLVESTPVQASPEVLQALERGRRVLAREFGL